MDVIVFHGNGCSACHAEMEFLEKARVAFSARNVSTDPAAREALIALGSRTVPTTVINGRVVIGFDLARLKELLGL